MRILVVSDTHRKHDNLDIVIERVMPDRIYHLGDGEGCEDYIEAVAECPLEIVRGNCDGEVDQMVLDFPIMADYAVLTEGERLIYATHGHIYNENNLPPLSEGDVLIHGHTHVLKAERREGYTLLNPGSVSIPKEGNIPTYAILEDGIFIIKGFEGEIVKTLDLNEKGTEKA